MLVGISRNVWFLDCINLSMTDARHSKLVDDYRDALRFWSETRALYPPESWEVSEITERLKELERHLSYRGPGLFKMPPARAKQL
jgi:hypothetical protein